MILNFARFTWRRGELKGSQAWPLSSVSKYQRADYGNFLNRAMESSDPLVRRFLFTQIVAASSLVIGRFVLLGADTGPLRRPWGRYTRRGARGVVFCKTSLAAFLLDGGLPLNMPTWLEPGLTWEIRHVRGAWCGEIHRVVVAIPCFFV